MNVLFITNHYLDRNIGGPNASKGFINAFAKIFPNMSLVYPDYPNSNIDNYIPPQVKKIPCKDTRTNLKKIIDIYRGRFHRYYPFLKDFLHNNHYDLIIIDHSILWEALTEVFINSGSKLITIHHNVERRFLRDNPKHFLYRNAHRKYAEIAESDAIKYSSINLVLTNNDIDEFKILFPQIKGNFYHLPCMDFHPKISSIAAKPHELHTFIITGSLSFAQSNRPIIEFLKDYYPILCRVLPNCKLIIAGSNPTRELEVECNMSSNVQLVKNPSDMAPLLQQASYYICPINMGSGQKTRVADGLKSGLPILCHEISAYGYEDMVKKGFMFTYVDKISFEKALINILNRNLSRRNIIDGYQESYSIEAGSQRILNILKAEKIL